jgi:hypothetical protein
MLITMNITQLPNKETSCLPNNKKSIAAQLILTLMLLVLTACVPQTNSIPSPVFSDTHLPEVTPSQGLSRPTLNPDALEVLRTAPGIISTINPDGDRHPKNSPTPQVPLTPAENQLTTLAKEDLSQRLGVPMEDIELLSLENVTWPDGALGCPQAGVEYIQVQREGTRFLLRVGKRTYPYHSGGGKDPFLCEHPDPFPGSSTPAPNPLDTK